MKLYNGITLNRIGNSIGKILKINAHTSATIRGKYICLCMEVLLNICVQSHILIGIHNQIIFYEDSDKLCKTCGQIGAHQHGCLTKIGSIPVFNSMDVIYPQPTNHDMNGT